MGIIPLVGSIIKFCQALKIAHAAKLASTKAATESAKQGIECTAKNACFIAGTLVLCKDDNGEETHKKIEDIEVGDLVWAYDEETGTSDWKPVVRLFRNETSSWCTAYVKVDGKIEEITSTLGHKYFLPNNSNNRNPNEKLEHASYEGLSEKWVSAQDLKYDDKVLLFDGRYGIIQKVKIKKFDNLETTYNFEVEDFHTYYVGENGVCVHNNLCQVTAPNGKTLYRGGNDLFENLADDITIIDNMVQPGGGPSLNTD